MLPLGFPQFAEATSQLVIFNQPLKYIQNDLVTTFVSLCDKPVCVSDAAIIFDLIHKTSIIL